MQGITLRSGAITKIRGRGWRISNSIN